MSFFNTAEVVAGQAAGAKFLRGCNAADALFDLVKQWARRQS